MNTDYIKYKKLITRKRKHLDKLNSELTKLLKECPHEEVEEKTRYISGGYDYTSTTEYWNECKLCSKQSKVRVVDHRSFN